MMMMMRYYTYVVVFANYGSIAGGKLQLTRTGMDGGLDNVQEQMTQYEQNGHVDGRYLRNHGAFLSQHSSDVALVADKRLGSSRLQRLPLSCNAS